LPSANKSAANSGMPQSVPTQRQSALASADTTSEPGEAMSETGAAPPSLVQAESNAGETTWESLPRDPLDDNLPSFGKNDKPQTIRQHFRGRVRAQLQTPTATVPTPTTSTPSPANAVPISSSLQKWPRPPAATQREKGQSSQPTYSVSPRAALSPTNLADAALSVSTQAHNSPARDTLQQTSQLENNDSLSPPGARKRAFSEENRSQQQQQQKQQQTTSRQEKRRRLGDSASILNRNDETAVDECESESVTESESIAEIFSRAPGKRPVKTTSRFFEAQATLRKALPVPSKPVRKGSNSRSHSGPKGGRARQPKARNGYQSGGRGGPKRYTGKGVNNSDPAVERASLGGPRHGTNAPGPRDNEIHDHRDSGTVDQRVYVNDSLPYGNR
jgi:hypothetical protein